MARPRSTGRLAQPRSTGRLARPLGAPGALDICGAGVTGLALGPGGTPPRAPPGFISARGAPWEPRRCHIAVVRTTTESHCRGWVWIRVGGKRTLGHGTKPERRPMAVTWGRWGK